MQVVGGRNDDCINVLSLQKLAEINVSRAALIEPTFRSFCIAALHLLVGIVASYSLDITNCHHLNIVLPEESVQVTTTHHADANESEVDAIIRRGRQRHGSRRVRKYEA